MSIPIPVLEVRTVFKTGLRAVAVALPYNIYTLFLKKNQWPDFDQTVNHRGSVDIFLLSPDPRQI